MFQIKALSGGAPTVTVVTSDSSNHTWCSSPDRPLAARTISAILAAARHLRETSHTGAISKALSGKNLAMLVVAATGEETSGLAGAARELGARVAEVRFVETEESMRRDLASLARLLGRMYDAIDCGTLAPSTVSVIKVESGVPVYAGLGLDDHPAKVLGDLMTLCDHQHPTAPASTILFLGDPQTRRGCAFLSAAREMGFSLRVEAHARPASNEAMFVVDATYPQHWSLHGPATPIDEVRRSANHHFVMQTALLETIARH